MKNIIVDEAQIFEMNPTEIKLSKELPRHRKDMGDIKKMVESIKTFGQLQPVVINREGELIYGGRRLAACMLAGINVRVCYKDTVDPVLMRELELEENIQRKSLTPAEETYAIRDLVELKQKRLGKPRQGVAGGGTGFTLEDAAEVVGKSKGYIIEAMQLAEALDQFPELAQAKKKSHIKKAYKGLQRVSQNLDAVAKYEETVKLTNEFVLVNRDAMDHMKGIPDNSIDLLLVDPIYGINIDSTAISIGGVTGGNLTTSGIKYEDSAEKAMELCQTIAKESARFCKETGHAYVFCASSHFWTLKEMFNKTGWNCAERPIIWWKRETGQNNNPHLWFSAVYEMILFARMPSATLKAEGRPDLIQCDPVLPSKRLHSAEKPIPLLKELIERTTLPGGYLYDPCMGSGSSIEAANEMKLFAIGCDIAADSYATALARMVKYHETNQKSQKLTTGGDNDGQEPKDENITEQRPST
ncbi:ParB/RepB/Spo0J family partition protein [Candidatus Micrarchaeota archaeon]|nr:ParB/RepB/Spo0J family partition protein [Candidatus Micrarchaeota archaeon]